MAPAVTVVEPRKVTLDTSKCYSLDLYENHKIDSAEVMISRIYTYLDPCTYETMAGGSLFPQILDNLIFPQNLKKFSNKNAPKWATNSCKTSSALRSSRFYLPTHLLPCLVYPIPIRRR